MSRYPLCLGLAFIVGCSEDVGRLGANELDGGSELEAGSAVDVGPIDGGSDSGSLVACPADSSRDAAVVRGVMVAQHSVPDVVAYVDGYFYQYEVRPIGETLGCAGPCELRRDIIEDAGAQDTGVPMPWIGTGTITIAGLQTGTMTLYADSRSEREYGVGLAGGEALTAQSTGDPLGLPAFVVSWEAPAFPATMSPALSRSASTPIDPTHDLDLTWSPSPQGSGTLVLTISGTLVPPGSQHVTATCRFPASAGAGRVPRSILGAFRRDQLLVAGTTATASTSIAVGSEVLSYTAEIEVGYGLFDPR